jgi:hypothetical protein
MMREPEGVATDPSLKSCCWVVGARRGWSWTASKRAGVQRDSVVAVT